MAKINRGLNTNFPYIDFIQNLVISDQTARLTWNESDRTLNLGVKQDVTQQIGQEVQICKARNTTDGTIYNGQVVYIDSVIGQRPTIKPANNTDYMQSQKTIGVVTEDVVKNEDGVICTFGYVRELNTLAFNDGDLLYLSTDGNLTNVRPFTQNLVFIGYCLYSHGVHGSLFVRPRWFTNVWGDIPNGNYTKVNQGVEMYGTDTRWEDLQFQITTGKVGANAKPDFDYDNIGYLYPQNDPTEILYMRRQFKHEWKEGSSISFHVHYRQTTSSIPIFKAQYAWINIGEDFTTPLTWTTVVMDTPVITFVSNPIHQINKATALVSGTGKTISSQLAVKLFRDDNVVTGDVLVIDFDVHYEKDSLGSKEIYIK